ncbi:hypothetical protein U1Q18_032742 [Sarracenia purpurea var. burkii]
MFPFSPFSWRIRFGLRLVLGVDAQQSCFFSVAGFRLRVAICSRSSIKVLSLSGFFGLVLAALIKKLLACFYGIFCYGFCSVMNPDVAKKSFFMKDIGCQMVVAPDSWNLLLLICCYIFGL